MHGLSIRRVLLPILAVALLGTAVAQQRTPVRNDIFDLFAGQRINDGHLDLVEGLDCQIVVVTDEGKAKRSLDAFETVWERIHQRL